jgi:hypothetical protein
MATRGAQLALHVFFDQAIQTRAANRPRFPWSRRARQLLDGRHSISSAMARESALTRSSGRNPARRTAQSAK